ncbi:hypothetical protein HMPREF1051_2014 [Neisseria sicca VK64]|uniref:Uncharacterized protein n=1 Tax=Neisseria sicca VK64 TaxID=1095748 RepID=I2NUI7_NEISI|nr:hypothetical protein HMPREF1051_2014 [Neisseria sicca VK64]
MIHATFDSARRYSYNIRFANVKRSSENNDRVFRRPLNRLNE